MYKFKWTAGSKVSEDLLEKFADLYSSHYGLWGQRGRHPGSHIKLSPDLLRKWLGEETHVAWATADDEVVGYAITVQSSMEGVGDIAWVTQLVVHSDHRDKDVGKTLLFTAWKFTDFFAWGLLSANPFAVRALERATRRMCLPYRIQNNAPELHKFGCGFIDYVKPEALVVVNAEESRIDSKFFIDHTDVPNMLKMVERDGHAWTLGDIPDGWEWFAFTFRDQVQVSLTKAELEEMLRASDEVTKMAYGRMLLDSSKQKWASHHEAEADFILQELSTINPQSILDFGCGLGRHALEIAARGIRVVGVDYVEELIVAARQKAESLHLSNVQFNLDDCRVVSLKKQFDAIICLYDVVGSFVEPTQNRAILANIAKHLRPGGLALISVMNMELTVRKAQHWFVLDEEPDRLLTLKPSRTMENTGDVFNPEFYMIDRHSFIVYRKEQFKSGSELPEEFLVRDRRYNRAEIENECTAVGLDVIWSRFVRAGRWSESLSKESDNAKEILLLCQKPLEPQRQLSLFGS